MAKTEIIEQPKSIFDNDKSLQKLLRTSNNLKAILDLITQGVWLNNSNISERTIYTKILFCQKIFLLDCTVKMN